MDFVRTWFRRYFSDPQVVALAIVLLAGTGAIMFAGNMLTPVLASIVISYLLEGPVRAMERRGVPRMVAVVVVFLVFVAVLVYVFFGLLPQLTKQATQLLQALPQMITRGQDMLLNLPKQYPHLFSEEQVNDLLLHIRAEAATLGQHLLSRSMASVLGLITIAVYLFLVPLMVFFFLKDKHQIVEWFTRFLPRERRLALAVWHDVDAQAANYVRGKCMEIAFVGAATYVPFAVMKLEFAMLLSVLVALSVLVPYVGAVAVTVPVAITAYWQWGLTSDFAYLMAAYLIVQAIDGNVLVPLLFSEVVNLHPVAIIVSILLFGGLWGFWGVFFAIPLATLVQAVIKAWPAVDGDAVPAPDGRS